MTATFYSNTFDLYIDKYIVTRMRVRSLPCVEHNGHRVTIINAPMQIKVSPSHDQEFKVLLTPVGDFYKSIVSERAWYTCDIEHRIRSGESKVFDTVEEAGKYARKLNDIDYPSKPRAMWYKIVKLFKRK